MSIIKIPKCTPIKIPTEAELIAKPYNLANNVAIDQKTADQYAQEQVKTSGVQIDYYALDMSQSIIDPLYIEPLSRKHSKPYKIYALITWTPGEFSVREEGVHTIFQSAVWIARKELEDVGLRQPEPGDMMRFWNTPFFNFEAANSRNIEGAGLFFDIIEVKDDGHLFDSPSFTGFKIDIKRRTEFGGERKLLGE